MFDKEFYPTPQHVLEMMDLDPFNKVILEPSAGKGDIVDYCLRMGAKEILSCEKNDDLRKIVATKSKLICADFFNLTAEQVSHINAIYMNPPFSNAHKHIIHAFKIAPEGCEIVSLCNYESLESYHASQELKRLISDYGESINLGDCFLKAERKTGCEIGLIKLFKPVVSAEQNWDGFFTCEEQEDGSTEGVLQYNEVRSIVNSYVGAIKMFDEFYTKLDGLNNLTNNLGHSNLRIMAGYYRDEFCTRTDFAKSLQKAAWNTAFKKMKIDKFVTKGVLEKINKFVETQSRYPFTMKNVYQMMRVIIATRSEVMKESIIETVDYFTRYTHENRFGVEGWKTNSGYLLNKKFIVDYVVETSWSEKLTIRHSANCNRIEDLVKVMCFITGNNFDLTEKTEDGQEIRLYPYFNTSAFKGHIESNFWYDYTFFEVKFFKKGTAHFKFKSESDWKLLNSFYAQSKGLVLPEQMKTKKQKAA